MNIPLQTYFGLHARYLRTQPGRVLALTVFLLGGITLQLIAPQALRMFIDTARSTDPIQALWAAAGLFIGLSLFQRVVNLAASYTAENVGWNATNALRSDLALHCLRLDMGFHKTHTPGEMIERIDGDVEALANFFSSFTVKLLGNGLLVVGILGLLFRESPWVGTGLTLYTILTLVGLAFIQRIAAAGWSQARQAHAELYGYLEERISGAEEIQAASGEAYAMRGLYQRLNQMYRHVRWAFLIGTQATSLTDLLYMVAYALGLGLGVWLYQHNQATLGTAYLIVFYIGMLSNPLQQIRAEAQDLQHASASIGRVRELFSLRSSVSDPEVQEGQTPQTFLAPEALEVRFDQVSFHYEDHSNVLEDVSFSIQPGRVLGVLGRTGSGKTTLARLLFRLYDPSKGGIALNGNDLRSLPVTHLRQHVGMVTQDVQLFKASVRENLTFFNSHITDTNIEAALTELRLWEWAAALPQGLDTLLGPGGQGLSAGEAQLLAFARVFLKDPGMVVLDEASSRLDPATEALLERAIGRLLQGRTAMIIAHRLQTVHRADDILILENGQVAEYGPRVALAANPNSRFYRLLQTGLQEALV